MADFADALAPGLVLAQAIGRWGNYFNQELYGAPTTLPCGLWIDPANRPADTPDIALYQLTFLYELLWDLGVVLLLLWAGKWFALRDGRLFALYVAAYTVGRAWVEALRVDHANHILGLRLNDWTSLMVFAGAVTYLIVRRPRHGDSDGALPAATGPSSQDRPAPGNNPTAGPDAPGGAGR